MGSEKFIAKWLRYVTELTYVLQMECREPIRRRAMCATRARSKPGAGTVRQALEASHRGGVDATLLAHARSRRAGRREGLPSVSSPSLRAPEDISAHDVQPAWADSSRWSNLE